MMAPPPPPALPVPKAAKDAAKDVAPVVNGKGTKAAKAAEA